MPSKRRRTTSAPTSLFAFQDIVTSVTGVLLLVAMSMAIQVASAPATQVVDSMEESETLEAKIVAAEAEALRLQAFAEQSQDLVQNASTISPGAAAEMLASLRREVELGKVGLTRLRGRLASNEAERDRLQDSVNEALAEAGIEDRRQDVEDLRAKIVKLKNSSRLLFNLPRNISGPIYLLELFPGEMRIAKAGVTEPPMIIRAKEPVQETERAIRSRPSDAHWVLFAHPGTTGDLASLRGYFNRRGRTIGFDLLPNGLTVVDPAEGAP